MLTGGFQSSAGAQKSQKGGEAANDAEDSNSKNNKVEEDNQDLEKAKEAIEEVQIQLDDNEDSNSQKRSKLFQKPEIEIEKLPSDKPETKLNQLQSNSGDISQSKPSNRIPLILDEQSENDFVDYDEDFPEDFEDQEEVKVSEDNLDDVEAVSFWLIFSITTR